MIRIDRDEIDEIDEKYYWNNELFTGIMFEWNPELEDSTFISKKISQDGVIVSDYKNKYIAKYIDNNCLEVHIGALELDITTFPRAVLYNNKSFTGIAYGSDDEFIDEEVLYIDGIGEKPKLQMKYTKNGILIYFAFHDQDKMTNGIFSDIYEWYSNGELKGVEIGLQYMTFQAKFKKDTKLSILDIDENYFKNIEMIKNKSSFEIYEEKSFLENIYAETKIMLFNKGINDEVFFNLWLNQGLKNVCNIYLTRLAITEKSFELLKDLTNLKQINIEECQECNIKILKEIKKKNPNCYIELDREEIVL